MVYKLLPSPAALPLIPRRRYETFLQVAPPLLAGLRAVAGDPLADNVEGGDSAEDVECWAARRYPRAVVALAQAVLASLQPGEAQLQAALARFGLQVLVSSKSDLLRTRYPGAWGRDTGM